MATLDGSRTGGLTSAREASTPTPDGRRFAVPAPTATPELSVLFDRPHGTGSPVPATDDVFHDLHLDDIVATLTSGRDEYDLAPFFAHPVDRVATVRYRQKVFRDLDGTALFDEVAAFAEQMRSMRRHLTRSRDRHAYRRDQQRWFLDAAQIYSAAVHRFADHLDVLRARLLDEDPDLVTQLHRRASDWHDTNDDRAEAIIHAKCPTAVVHPWYIDIAGGPSC